MKDNLNRDNADSIRIHGSDNQDRCLAGTFNRWLQDCKTLHSSGVGHWWKETALVPGGDEYCLVVDGKWMPNRLAKESVLNPSGGRNSLLKVACSPEAPTGRMRKIYHSTENADNQ